MYVLGGITLAITILNILFVGYRSIIQRLHIGPQTMFNNRIYLNRGYSEALQMQANENPDNFYNSYERIIEAFSKVDRLLDK